MAPESIEARPHAQLTLFGCAPQEARVQVAARAQSWRMKHALIGLAVAWAAIPLVALIPPHIPWALAAFITGIVLAYRRSTERVSLLELDSRCPRCSTPIGLEKPVRFIEPYTLSCPGCHNDLRLHIELDEIPTGEATAA